MRNATTFALAALLTFAGLTAARADIHVPGMTARQESRMKATIARTLTARGAGNFTAKDIVFDSSKSFVHGPAAGKQTRTQRLGFFVVTGKGKPEVRSHVGPIPFPHEVTPATGIAGAITVRVGNAKRAWSATQQGRPDYTITTRKVTTEAEPVEIILN